MKKIFGGGLCFVTVLAIVTAVLGSFSHGFYPLKVQAQTASSSALTGWAWSDNIGWISFSGNSPAYGLTEDGSGNLSGYAWSDGVGWIKFGGLTGFPSGSGTTNSNATIDSSNTLHGWARACAGTAPGDCSSMTSRTDGWDGWISLDGTNYGVNFASGNGQYSQSAYTWGSDVIGWITFNPFNLSTTSNPGGCDPSQEVCGGNASTTSAAVYLYVNNSTSASVATGTPATLTWNTQNVTTCTESSAGIGTDSHWNGSLGSATSTGATSTSAFSTTGTETYTLACTANSQAGGGSISAYATLYVTSNGYGGGSICTAVPSNASLCSGSAAAAANNSSTLVPSCTASGGLPVCQYSCSNGYHYVGSQCIGNGSLQEQ